MRLASLLAPLASFAVASCAVASFAVVAAPLPAEAQPAVAAEPAHGHLLAPVEGEDYTVQHAPGGVRLSVPTDLGEETELPPLAPSVELAPPGAPGDEGAQPRQRSLATAPPTGAAGGPAARTAHVLGDGAWSFYMNPRAYQTAKATYLGSVTSTGEVQATRLATDRNRLDHVTLGRVPRVDDHASPTFTQLPSGQIGVFWSGHGDTPVRYRLSRTADSLSFGPVRQLTGSGIEKRLATYTVVLRMAGESQRYWLFTRLQVGSADPRQNWWLTTSNDLKRWTKAVQITRNPYRRKVTQGWPYLRLVGDGNRTIDIAITDGDPGNLATNSQFHIRYTQGRFVRSDGSLIRTMADLKGGRDGAEPLDPREGTLIYNGSGREGTARVYDIARGPGGQLALAMTTKHPRTGVSSLKWFRHTGRTWVGSTIQRSAGKASPNGYELVYGAPHRAYLVSIRPGEGGRQLQEWWTEDQGRSWTFRAVAGGRGPTYRAPVVPWANRTPDRGPAATRNNVLWMAGRYTTFRDFRTRVEMETTGLLPVWVQTATVKQPGTASRRVGIRVRQGVGGPAVPEAAVRVTWTYPRTGVPKKYAGTTRTAQLRADRAGRLVLDAYQPPGTTLAIHVPERNGYGVAGRLLTVR